MVYDRTAAAQVAFNVRSTGNNVSIDPIRWCTSLPSFVPQDMQENEFCSVWALPIATGQWSSSFFLAMKWSSSSLPFLRFMEILVYEFYEISLHIDGDFLIIFSYTLYFICN